MKFLYKYPQARVPLRRLWSTPIGTRTVRTPEYELIDTGIFDQNRYFDVFVEYAKESPEDILIRITVANRGPDTASLHVLPTLWFRNTWSWQEDSYKPSVGASDASTVPGDRGLTSRPGCSLSLLRRAPCRSSSLKTRRTQERVFGSPNRSPYVKDGINDYVVHGRSDKVNPEKHGTKAVPALFPGNAGRREPGNPAAADAGRAPVVQAQAVLESPSIR